MAFCCSELEDELLMNLTQAHECIAILADEKRSCDNSKLAETSNNRAVVTSLEESVSFLSRTLPKLKSIKEVSPKTKSKLIVLTSLIFHDAYNCRRL